VRTAGLDAWHDAQEQEVEDAMRSDAVKRGIVRGAAVFALLAACFGVLKLIAYFAR
jgi:hypothetical protein